MKKISATALSKLLDISSKEFFSQLIKLDLIRKKDDIWELTAAGIKNGGSYQESKQYGRYIVWPENFDLEKVSSSSAKNTKDERITATVIAKEFEISSKKINFILSELGWVDKGLKGWLVTKQGEKQGGVQSEDKKSGIPYVRWPKEILDSNSLNETIKQVKGTSEKTTLVRAEPQTGFRDSFPAKYRSLDGRTVCSKAEMLICNWLYIAEIVHAYERKLPIEEDIYSDFYLPTGKVYLEYWDYENDAKYLARKVEKISIYKKYDLNLIELKGDDIKNLDDILPRLLLKYGVQAY